MPLAAARRARIIWISLSRNAVSVPSPSADASSPATECAVWNLECVDSRRSGHLKECLSLNSSQNPIPLRSTPENTAACYEHFWIVISAKMHLTNIPYRMVVLITIRKIFAVITMQKHWRSSHAMLSRRAYLREMGIEGTAGATRIQA